MKKLLCYLTGTVLFIGAITSVSLAADKQLIYENEKIKLQLLPRTPNQMAGFYEAREFPKKMVNTIARFCFMTVVIHNKTKNVFWLDLDNWKFVSDLGEVQRIHRKQWSARWKEMGIPMASQSTFRWTLLPENLEFFPDEREGGNIIFVSTKNVFSLQASFAVGKNKDNNRIVAQINNVQCAENIVEKAATSD